jgi:ABC-type lipoprotein release transport system permease subunit
MHIFRNLRRRYGRTTLITTGIALAIAFTTIMLSISAGIEQSASEILEETGVDLLIEPDVDLPPLFLEYTTIFEISDGREIANAMVEQNSKIRAAAPWYTKNLYMTKAQDSINASQPPKFTLTACKGSIPENNRYFSGVEYISGGPLPTQDDPFYASGTFDGGIESENFTHEITISQPLAKILEVSVGDTIYVNPVLITDEITNQTLTGWFKNATRFKIYGIMQESFEAQNALSAHLHLSELQYIMGKHHKDAVHRIYVSLYDEDDQDEVKAWLENDFSYRGNFTVHKPEDLLGDIQDLLKMFEGFSTMIIVITVLIATLFISTVLMISTRERSKEIGALRAIGISKFTINKFILNESLAICILSLIIGLLLGYIGSNIINDYVIQSQPSLPPDFRVAIITPILIVQVSILTILIALLASLGPCYWATSLKPVETLRNE